MSGVVGAVADRALRVWDSNIGSSGGVTVHRHTGVLGDEFRILAKSMHAQRQVAGVRSTAYLEWRYRRHAVWRHDILCARRGGTLLGFLVARTVVPEVLAVAELVTSDNVHVLRALTSALVRLGRERGADAINTEVLAG